MSDTKQELVLKARGLFITSDPLSDVPEGSLRQAINVDIDQNGLIEPRRGFEKLTGPLAATATKLYTYKGEILAHQGTSTISRYDAGGSAWENYSGTYQRVDSNTPVRAETANENLYFATAQGIQKLDSIAGSIVDAGVPQGLDIQASLSNSGSGFFTADNKLAYRVVWGFRDANNNLILGAPSQRVTITNIATGVDDTVTLDITIPAGITTSHFFQVYRSRLSGTASTEPSTELGLVYEASPGSFEITAKTISFTDETPDALIGATIYTASSQEGVVNSNYEPPLAKDLALFNGYLFGGNTKTKYETTVNLLGVGGTLGLAVDDTITIDDVVYTGKTAEAAASGHFRVFTTGDFEFVDADVSTVDNTITENDHTLQNGDAITLSSSGTLPAGLAPATVFYVAERTANTFKLSGTKGGAVIDITGASGGGTHTLSYGGTPSANIADTAQSLVRVINKYASNTSVYAYYMSDTEGLPGEIRIVERDVGGSAFTVISNSGQSWNPNLTIERTATNNEAKNGLWYSKFQEPEAVPLPNTIRVGNASSNILRIIPLRESLFIFTETGIYTLTGSDSSSFRVDLLDNTAKLLAPESAVTLQNQIYCLTDQGVVAVSDTGVELVSRPIESALLEAFGANLSGVKNYSFSVGYESDRKYLLFLPPGENEVHPTICYAYNTITNNWTTYDIAKKAGIVNPVDDKLYLADATTALVSRERKSFSFRDQVDEDLAVTVSSVDGTTLTLTSAIGVNVGDLYYESENIFGIITSVDTITHIITVDQDLGFSAGSALVLAHFRVTIEWNPVLGGAPSTLKQFSEVVLIANKDINEANLIFTSDVSFTEDTVTMRGNSVSLWGLFPWGQALWGGVSDVQPYRTYVPRLKQRGGLLRIRFEENAVYNDFQLSGLRIAYRPLGGRIRR